MTSISTVLEWPLQFRWLHDVRKGSVTAVSVGDGWTKFIADQNLGPGAFLTFEVADSRRLVAALHHRSAPEDLSQPHTPDLDTGLARDCSYRDHPNVGHIHPRQSVELPEVRSNDRAQFRKTLRKSHTKKSDSSRIVSANPLSPNCRHTLLHVRVFATLEQKCKPRGWAQDIPTSFWRTHGPELFDGIWYNLRGPLLACNVKTTCQTYGKQTFCSFTLGWASFCTANALKIGDTVEFTKVGVGEFEVTKL